MIMLKNGQYSLRQTSRITRFMRYFRYITVYLSKMTHKLFISTQTKLWQPKKNLKLHAASCCVSINIPSQFKSVRERHANDTQTGGVKLVGCLSTLLILKLSKKPVTL